MSRQLKHVHYYISTDVSVWLANDLSFSWRLASSRKRWRLKHMASRLEGLTIAKQAKSSFSPLSDISFRLVETKKNPTNVDILLKRKKKKFLSKCVCSFFFFSVSCAAQKQQHPTSRFRQTIGKLLTWGWTAQTGTAASKEVDVNTTTTAGPECELVSVLSLMLKWNASKIIKRVS